MRCVVDTNVPVVANGRETNASVDCRTAAVDFLQKLVENGRVILDLGGEIQEEYRTYLNPKGEPGVGDRFYLMILNSAVKLVERVELARDPETGEYEDFPKDAALAGFDKSDRKFAAASRKCKAAVINATDADWLEYIEPLNRNGIRVQFVCGLDTSKWIER